MTYDYLCKICGKEFEVEQKITEEPLKVCETCGGEVVRLISGGLGFQLKGAGWAKEGYSSK